MPPDAEIHHGLSSSSQGQPLRKGPQKHVPTASYPAKSCKVCSIDCWASIFFFFFFTTKILFILVFSELVDIVGIHSN